MTGVVLVYAHATDCYNWGSLRGVYRWASKMAAHPLFPSSIGPIALSFDLGLPYATSDTSKLRIPRVLRSDGSGSMLLITGERNFHALYSNELNF